MTRFSKIVVALIASTALLFAQLAVAAHPCPTLAKAIAGAAAHYADDDCECPSEDATPSALCKKHCDNDKQNLAIALSIDIPAFFAAYSIDLIPHDHANAAQDHDFQQFNRSPPHAPPLLKYANLRI